MPAPVDEAKIAEASIWVARLQSNRREPEVESQFRAWLDAAEANRIAFEMASETWELAGGAAVAPRRARRRPSRRPLALALAASLVATIGIGGWYMQRAVPIETAIGERRSLTLPDGSIVTLNTATTISTAFADDRRLVRLDHGEAAFEVAHDTLRPFIVQSGDIRVVAVGTVFDVRADDNGLSVTLADGKVHVIAPAPSGGAGPVETVMQPGQRLWFANAAVRPSLQPVNLQAARAWRNGQVVFADTPLGDAAREMNRYTSRPIGIGDPATAALRISGSFRTTDTAQFARAVSEIYGLKLTEAETGLELRR